MGQLFLGDTGHPLEVIMAGVAEVCGAKAEENSHRAAVPTFILKEIRAMLRAHLTEKNNRYIKKKNIICFSNKYYNLIF